MSQPFLEAGEGRLLVPGFHINYPVGRQPRRLQTRRKQILVPHAPQDLALGARHDAGHEQSRRGAIQRAITGACDLMQRPQRQPAARQPRIHLRQPKRKNPGQSAFSCLQPVDFFAQKIDGG